VVHDKCEVEKEKEENPNSDEIGKNKVKLLIIEKGKPEYPNFQAKEHILSLSVGLCDPLLIGEYGRDQPEKSYKERFGATLEGNNVKWAAWCCCCNALLQTYNAAVAQIRHVGVVVLETLPARQVYTSLSLMAITHRSHICHNLYTHARGSYVCPSSHDLQGTLEIHVLYWHGTHSHSSSHSEALLGHEPLIPYLLSWMLILGTSHSSQKNDAFLNHHSIRS
ncbi:hypothetical protein HAX54_021937, partial [Datura stramonium]|nr:hypothetical protein [Datura stramonium]